MQENETKSQPSTKTPTSVESKTAIAVDVFAYDNYRSFLKDWLEAAKHRNANVSFRSLARMAGFTSPNFLKLVIDGDRNLSPDSIERFQRFLKLNKSASAYFRTLVLMNQAKSGDEKFLFSTQLAGLKKPANRPQLLTQSQSDYYTTWYMVAIRELVSLPDFKEDPKWIANRLVPSITPSEAQKALEQLQELKILVRDSKGHLKQSSSLISLGEEVQSILVKKFLSVMSVRASESLNIFSYQDREISSFTMSLDQDSFDRAREVIIEARKKLHHIAEQCEGKSGRVFQSNFHLFPLSKEISQ